MVGGARLAVFVSEERVTRQCGISGEGVRDLAFWKMGIGRIFIVF